MRKCGWITFIGEGRSGHTIISAILDSHPNIRMGEERKSITRWIRNGRSREQIINDVKTCGQGKERKKVALPGSLTYEEPLLYLGDKCGWDAIQLLKRSEVEDDIYDRFSEYMGMDVKIIHTVRDPRENISAYLQSPKYIRQFPTYNRRIQMCTRRYARFYGRANRLLTRYPHFNLYNEEFCLDTKKVITELCTFLDLPMVEPWFTNAVTSAFDKPHLRSTTVHWDPKWWDTIGWRIIDKYDFFERYKR